MQRHWARPGSAPWALFRARRRRWAREAGRGAAREPRGQLKRGKWALKPLILAALLVEIAVEVGGYCLGGSAVLDIARGGGLTRPVSIQLCFTVLLALMRKQRCRLPLPPNVELPRTEPSSNALKEALGAAVEVPWWPHSPFCSLARTPRAERKTVFGLLSACGPWADHDSPHHPARMARPSDTSQGGPRS